MVCSRCPRKNFLGRLYSAVTDSEASIKPPLLLTRGLWDIIIINVSKVQVTGRKREQRFIIIIPLSRWDDCYSFKDLIKENPERIFLIEGVNRHASKTKLGDVMLSNL